MSCWSKIRQAGRVFAIGKSCCLELMETEAVSWPGYINYAQPNPLLTERFCRDAQDVTLELQQRMRRHGREKEVPNETQRSNFTGEHDGGRQPWWAIFLRDEVGLCPWDGSRRLGKHFSPQIPSYAVNWNEPRTLSTEGIWAGGCCRLSSAPVTAGSSACRPRCASRTSLPTSSTSMS